MPVVYVDFFQKARNIGQLLQMRARSFPNQTALQYLAENSEQPVTISYAVLHQRAKGMAANLQKIVHSGERAILMYTSDIDYVCAIFACVYAGIIAIPVLPIQSKKDLKRLKEIIRETQPRLCLTNEYGMQSLGGNFWRTACVKNMWPVMMDQTIEQDQKDSSAVLRYQGNAADPEDIVIIDYVITAGDKLQAHYLSHGELLEQAQLAAVEFNLSHAELVVSLLSSFASEGLIAGLISPFYRSCTAVMSELRIAR